jgi:OOP family OmpA-OmpF porin
VAPKGPETLFKVYFRSGEAVLTHEAIVVLRSWVLASRATGQPVKALRLVGHADVSGEQQRNLALSEKRASAVRRYLEGLGCPCEGVDAVGMGSGEPMATNRTPGGRAMNRRVEGVAFKVCQPVSDSLQ